MTEIVKFHREANHPTMRNKPNAPVNVHIELNMVAEKKVLFIPNSSFLIKVSQFFRQDSWILSTE